MSDKPGKGKGKGKDPEADFERTQMTAKDLRDARRIIVPHLEGEPREIFLWLHGLFHVESKEEPGTFTDLPAPPDEFPEAVRLQAIYDDRDRGPDLDDQAWKPHHSPVPPTEYLAALANRFYGAAKRHCSANAPGDARRRNFRMRYCLFAFSNLKGPDAYKTHPFVVGAWHKEYERESDVPAADDRDAHQDRFVRDLMAHARWDRELTLETLSGATKLQQEIIQDQRKQLQEMATERRQMIVTAEEALSKRSERKILESMAELKMEVLRDLVGTVKGYLGPAVAYLTKGKVGIVQGLRQFLDAMSDDARLALLGSWDAQPGQTPRRLQAGILDEDQALMIIAIVDGKQPPSMVPQLVASLRQEQLGAIMQGKLPDGSPILTEQQQQQLFGLARAAKDTTEEQPS